MSHWQNVKICPNIKTLKHLKTVTIPVVIGALGMIKKGTEKSLNLAEMQKIALTGTAHILRKTFSMYKNQTMNN